jgi:hypothetical protein
MKSLQLIVILSILVVLLFVTSCSNSKNLDNFKKKTVECPIECENKISIKNIFTPKEDRYKRKF